MMTMNFDPTLHGSSGSHDVTAGTVTAGSAPSSSGVAVSAPTTTATGTAGASGSGGTSGKGTGALTTFQGFLKTAGHVAGVMLSEIVRFVVPIAQVAAVADPAAAPALAAFTTSLELVQTAVISAQQRWSGEGSAANAQKLADVLATVEKPVVLLFAQVGLAVDTAYVTNLVNGVVAVLNAQPGVVLDGVTPPR